MLNTILTILILMFAVTIFLWQISNIIAILSGCLYVKANEESVRKILKNYAKKDSIFLELGSGSGNILLVADNLKMKATGFEIAPYYYILSKIRTFFKKNVIVKFRNIFDADLSQADVIYLYLMPKLIKKLLPKLLAEIKKGTILISAGFPIEKLKLVRLYTINNRKYFVYQKS